MRVWREHYCCRNMKNANAKMSNKGIFKRKLQGKTLNYTDLLQIVSNVGWRQKTSAGSNEWLHTLHFGTYLNSIRFTSLIIIWYKQMGIRNKVGTRINFSTNHHHNQYPWAWNSVSQFNLSSKKRLRMG